MVNTSFTNLLLYRTFVPLSIIFYKILAVSSEIVPTPVSHRSVVSLVSSQNHITFSRSLNFQGAYKTKKSSPPINRGKDFMRWYHIRETKKTPDEISADYLCSYLHTVLG